MDFSSHWSDSSDGFYPVKIVRDPCKSMRHSGLTAKARINIVLSVS